MMKNISRFARCCIRRPIRAAALNSMSNAARTVLFAIALIFATPLCPRLFALDDHNPIGVTGTFEGVITTGCAYNVVNHNTTRQIDDIVVAGAIGKYPLKLTRYYNSRRTSSWGLMGPGWSHEYGWVVYSSHSWKVEYPNGNVWDGECFGAPVGGSDGWESLGCNTNCVGDFRLADGGTVHFDNTNSYFQARTIKDPYGQTTTLTYLNSGQLNRVTEPGGRYLQFTYGASQLLTRVDAYDGQGHQIDWVVYHYTAIAPGGGHQSVNCLTSVDYSDGTHAYYTYEQDNVPEDIPSGSVKAFPLVNGCNDTRYHGPMRRIAYDYQNQGPHGAILKERYWDGVAGNEGSGPVVSTIGPTLQDPRVSFPDFPTAFTETRGDGPTRSFTYSDLHLHRITEEDTCPTLTLGPPQQFLQTYTDFQGHTTTFSYDANWYVNSVRDANNQTTSYTRGPSPGAYPGPKGIGQILRITHPDTSHVDYTYYDESPDISGHYLKQITDERGNITYHSRDANHRIIRTDYKDASGTILAFETFAYNNFGQVLTHRLKNNAYERFAYDVRGLLTDKWNPKQNAIPADSDPHTHYTYYTFGPWPDRVMSMTLPANVTGGVASERYEYDRNASGAGVPGRGLVTKITHADNTYQSFDYDDYGNKIWEQNELRQQTTYTYDLYNRVFTVKNPLNQTTTYTYAPTNGTGTSPYLHTTNNPDKITTPTGIVTTNDYDQNFRNTSTTVGASTTRFGYDNVGNPTTVTDPLNHTTTTVYDSRNRKKTVTNALNQITTFTYDAASNVTRIDRPDTTWETKTYDAMNRVLTDTVPQTSTVNLITSFVYNPSGTVQKVTDPKGQVTTFQYDASDRRTKMTYPNSTDSQSWNYDDAHNLASRATVGGNTQSFTYDGRNRKKTMTWSNGIDSATFGYDAAGRFTTATNPNSAVTRSYDAAGRLILDQQAVTGLATKSVNYVYDADGKPTRLYGTGAGYDYTFSYDTMGRFETITPTGGSIAFQYYYDAVSNETKRRTNLSGGVYVDKLTPRDNLNRMSRRDLQKSGTPFSAEAYTYDPMSRLTSVTYGSVSDQYDYYDDGELYWVKYNLATGGNPNRTVTYVFDRAGNRTSLADTLNGNATYVPNVLNEYATVGGAQVTNGPEHEIASYQGVDYTYLNDTHLVSVTSGSNSYSLAYDALGRCVKRTLNGTTTYYIYDGEKPILEYTNGTLAKNLYGKGIDEILMRADPTVNGGQPFYYEDNHEGSITHLVNTSGNVIESYRYDVFGAITNINYSNFKNRFLFTGREYSGATSAAYNAGFRFYEYRARAYHPSLGRFISEDPKGFVRRAGLGASPADWTFAAHPDEAEFNLFRYCGNDPVDFTDPMGLDTMANAMAVAEAVVPGQYEYNQMAASFQSGNYGMATGWGVTWVGSTVIGVLSGTNSTRLQAGLRAAESAAARRTVVAVIGKYLDTPSYVDVGKHLNKNVLNVPTKLWERMSPDQKWTATQKFLDNVIAHKGDLLFNKSITSIASQSGDFRRELDYVSQKGFVLSQDGWSMTRVVEDASTASRHVPLPTNP